MADHPLSGMFPRGLVPLDLAVAFERDARAAYREARERASRRFGFRESSLRRGRDQSRTIAFYNGDVLEQRRAIDRAWRHEVSASVLEHLRERVTLP